MNPATFPHPRHAGQLVRIDLDDIEDLERRAALQRLAESFQRAQETSHLAAEELAIDAEELAIDQLRDELHRLLEALHRAPLDATTKDLRDSLRHWIRWGTTITKLKSERTAAHWETAA